MMIIILFLGLISLNFGQGTRIQYTPDWQSLDSRPLPTWYDQAKVGIFIHWGVFSVPSFGNYGQSAEWFWWFWQGSYENEFKQFMANSYPPSFTYADFAKQFRAELFNPDNWADLFSASGAQYVVLTSKHHEGFCNWNTKYSFNWNSVQVGPNMDLVDKLASSIRQRTKLVFGLYHSLFEWFNPLYLQDKANQYKTNKFVKEKTMPELYELVNQYKPDIIWSDGEWEASDTYWNSTEFLAWLYNSSPVKDTVVTNDRWGSDTNCKHGGFYTCQDRYNPGKLVNHKWENCFTLDKPSWGFRREMNSNDVMTIEELLYQLVSTVSCGGNVLINIGPTSYGTIPALFQERLLQLGQWLKVNGEAIYSTTPWKFQNDSMSSNVWYTSINNSTTVYAIILQFPINGQLKLGDVKFNKFHRHHQHRRYHHIYHHQGRNVGVEDISLLGYGKVNYVKNDNYTLVTIPTDVLSSLKWAWTLKITGL